MTVTLDLPSSVAEAYAAEAQARGLTLDALVREVLLARQSVLAPAEMTPEEWVKEFQAWTRSHAADDLPILPDEAINRDFIYGERGL